MPAGGVVTCRDRRQLARLATGTGSVAVPRLLVVYVI